MTAGRLKVWNDAAGAWVYSPGGSGGSQPYDPTFFTGADSPTPPTYGYFALYHDSGGANTSGTFKLRVGGQTTDALAWDATAEDVVAALEALSTVGEGGVVVYTGYEGYVINDEPYFRWFGPDALGQSVPDPEVVDDTTDNGVISDADTQAGAEGDPSGAANLDYYIQTTSPPRNWFLDANAQQPNWLLLGFDGGRVGTTLSVGDDDDYVQMTDGSVASKDGEFTLGLAGSTFTRPLQIVMPDGYVFSGGVPGPLYVYDPAGVVSYCWWIGKQGHEIIKSLPAPDPDDILPGEVFSYFDDTNGAAKFIRIGKTADGTLVTVETAMSPP